MNITKTRWRIITLLSESDKTPTELARELKMSMPAVHTHLAYLESNSLIHKNSIKKGKTRPFLEYSLGDGFVYFIQATPKEARQRFLEVDDYLKLHLRIWSIPQKEFHPAIEKFWQDIENHIDDTEAIAVYGSVALGNAKKDSDIDILIIAKRNIVILEKKFGAKMYAGKMVMSQAFTPEQFVASGNFFQQALNGIKVLYDTGVLKRILDEYKNK